MDWMFIIGFAVSTLTAPAELPNTGIPEQNAPTIKTEYHEIGRRVQGKERCEALLREWEQRPRIGGQPIVERKCVAMPNYQAPIQGKF